MHNHVVVLATLGKERNLIACMTHPSQSSQDRWYAVASPVAHQGAADVGVAVAADAADADAEADDVPGVADRCAQRVLEEAAEEADAVAAGLGVSAEVGDDPALGGDPGVTRDVGLGV